eukprot:3277-Eustigmatos_ZCMA.PRE.1
MWTGVGFQWEAGGWSKASALPTFTVSSTRELSVVATRRSQLYIQRSAQKARGFFAPATM